MMMEERMDDQEYGEKRDYSAESREAMAEEGFALPDGSYPIKDGEDLKNAIQAFGRAKDKEAAKAHIMKRAKKLGMEDMIPEEWTSQKSDPEETEDKDEEASDEKGVLKVNADGEALKCAKGAGGECGYKAGDKVCGKCGAVAVMTKGDMAMDDSEEEEDDEEEVPSEEMDAKMKKRMAKLEKMGVKDASAGSFLCAFDRKVLNEGAEPCEGCSGGCFPVKGGADLLEIEVKAEEMYDATVVDSGYSDQYDKFVVDLRRKDGRLIEAIFSGAGEDEGWHPIPESALALGDEVIGGDEAIELALGAVQGKALSVGVQMFDGSVAYCVEVDGSDGYSYDVFVDTEGKVLAMDQWEYETATVQPAEQKDAKSSEIEAALLEFEALRTEEELREQGLI
jgi:hypothetical protein